MMGVLSLVKTLLAINLRILSQVEVACGQECGLKKMVLGVWNQSNAVLNYKWRISSKPLGHSLTRRCETNLRWI